MSSAPPDWEDQRAFLAILRHGSLSAAARALGLAQPTVRRRIEALEAKLGAALFTRGPSGLIATQEAEALRPHAEAMAIASEAFNRSASGSETAPSGTVRISAADVVGAEVLPPMLAELRVLYPQIIPELRLSNINADLVSQEVDVAVRMAPLQQAAIVGQRVGTVRMGLYAHRDYLARRGMPERLCDILAFDLIGPDRDPDDIAFTTQMLGEGGRAAVTIRTDNHLAQLALLRAGCGIGLAHHAIAARDKNLVPILRDDFEYTMETWIAMHEDLRRVRRVRVVFDHLVQGMRAYTSI